MIVVYLEGGYEQETPYEELVTGEMTITQIYEAHFTTDDVVRAACDVRRRARLSESISKRRRDSP